MKSSRGFTLIELMIVVVIVAILASVAAASYRSYIIKSNRAAAQSFMFQAANRQEQIMLDMRSYITVTAKANFPNAPTAIDPGINLSVPEDVSKNYDLAIVSGAGSYTITATPILSQLTDDTICGAPTLNQAGTKTPSTSGCW